MFRKVDEFPSLGKGKETPTPLGSSEITKSCYDMTWVVQ
jgi:hypothetical protein